MVITERRKILSMSLIFFRKTYSVGVAAKFVNAVCLGKRSSRPCLLKVSVDSISSKLLFYETAPS